MTTRDDWPGTDAPTTPALPWAQADWNRALAPTRRRRRPVSVRTLLTILVVLAVVGALVWRAVPEIMFTGIAAGEAAARPATAPPAPAAAAPADPDPATAAETGPPANSAAVTSAAVPTIAAVVPTLGTPGYVEITPDGRQAWIAHRDTRDGIGQYVISVLDLRLGTVVATVPSPAGPPRFIAFCSTGPGAGRAYVSVYSVRPDGQPDDNAPHLVSVIDQTTLVEIGQIPVGRRPFASSCSPDGATLVVPSHDDGRLDIIDTTTATLRTSVPVARNPHWAAHDALGQVWTANHESNAVTRLDTETLAIRDVTPNIGRSPHAVEVNPDSTLVAVVAFDSNELFLLDATTAAVVRTVAIGRGPQDVAWTTDGARVLTTDVDDDRVSVVDVTTGEITAVLQPSTGRPGTWDGPTSIAVTPDGTTAVVTLLNTRAVALLDLTVS